MTVDHICHAREKSLLQKCFAVLQRRVSITRYLLRRENLLVSRVLYHWRLYGKLNRIRSRYESSDQKKIPEELVPVRDTNTAR